ncbi:cyclic dehypoxanthine futalosine synthase [Moorella thermoacetica]|uniref:Cyclic dehypoxanthine futalosine synthase n=1 Tax=Moorella thermoacetica (strain ATCC 39073 / JCM 9320) TaxID=264732 RepID=Q2RHE5_MOOTA|nr:cyclic dehypoxanthinyl futalosine synthase [Moorella thermoacetica]AKX94658.1 cyclic dehypoxanthine futalosine synthase [Moorella thermoacetica]AKX97291.1 cyclic dehypoxanthine futalosine synthase [Moorella thermoacetica]OIQ57290.1 cyclic dehypoxanthine futalosine synthase [Moorella thermoacetica]QDA01119.1 Aminodeoxyfutalosine synthase [Moorella thermoacetica]TYL10278.1 Cyclic dehypoxanthine futalosine synthase [Moorella thermoacetica]
MKETIACKVLDGERLSFHEAERLYQEAGLLELGYLANLVRQKLHPEGTVTFVVDRNINYTNICVNACRFCAFYRLPGDPEGYLLSREEIGRKIEATLAAGGTQILMQGGLHPDLDLAWFEDLFSWIKSRYPVTLHSLSPVEIDDLARKEGLPVIEVLRRLKKAGLDSLPGGGAEILVDRVRGRVSPKKTGAARWLEVMRAAHALGMKSTATMVFGLGETMAERIAHLEAIRQLQDETGGFTAFIPWSFQPGNTELGGVEASTTEYLKLLALSRLYLDNIPNIQVSWVTQGTKVAQAALFFGANDFGSTMLEENVVRAAGASFRADREEILRCIQAAGFRPAQRDNEYHILRYYEAGQVNR